MNRFIVVVQIGYRCCFKMINITGILSCSSVIRTEFGAISKCDTEFRNSYLDKEFAINWSLRIQSEQDVS